MLTSLHKSNCRIPGGLLLLGSVFAAASTGCASYYSHYGSLSVETSEGKTRTAVISWESAEKPGWLGGSDASPVILETECSQRVLVFRGGDDLARPCGPGGEEAGGVYWCGDPAKDKNYEQTAAVSSQTICGHIEGSKGENAIADLGSRLAVTISCWPAQAVVGSGDDAVNQDYLRPSPVPYQFVVKKVSRGSTDDRKPVFSEKACKEE